jgi:trehalose 6-phosphate phosphatase
VTVALLPIAPDVERRLMGVPLLLMLDIDGTLAPLAATPNLAAVPKETVEVLDRIAALRETHIALVTGRSAEDAHRLVPSETFWIIGNHGAELRSPAGETTVNEDAARFRDVMASAVAELKAITRDYPGAFFEDKRWTASLHYRLADPAAAPTLESRFADVVARHGLYMSEGKKVFEMKPPVKVNKGTAVLALARKLVSGVGHPGSPTMIFAGDDVTDEDAFKELREHDPSAVTIRVTEDGRAPTDAEFRVRNPEELRTFLEWLGAARAA